MPYQYGNAVAIDGAEINLSVNIDGGEITLVNQMDGDMGTFMPILPDQYTGQTDVSPTEEAQTLLTMGLIMPDNVTVGAISSEYVGSDIPRKSSTDLQANGAIVTAPSGYYSENATKTVASGTEGTPTATKSAVNNHALTVTPSVTNTEGYINGGTLTGTPVTVSASELVSGTLTLTDIGTADVTNYAAVSVSIIDGNNIGYGVTDGSIPKVGIAKVGSAELGA